MRQVLSNIHIVHLVQKDKLLCNRLAQLQRLVY
uniref:Uncharacterized protein n=1 Tax=Siphoviridae sp. ct8rU2 TaxID=2825366 RepID=A0A8S5UWB6_9CAUD|nr:MAG TPA: hypothetical protein [Caudoviricetes sp.]DAF98739.1 MAG TPA: hypothetical protein [Siphoviridae sp. ct8rU2]